MKTVGTIILLGILMSACVSSKIEKEFNQKKGDVVLIISGAKAVEKKAAVNVLVPEYINNAPADTALLNIFNPYLLYYLDKLGYKKLVIKNEFFRADAFGNEQMIYSVTAGPLSFKEYKHKENVSNGADSKTVKMHGVEINPSAETASGISDVPVKDETIHVKANAYKNETQEGEFKQTYGVKDMIEGNKGGSVKYIHQVQQLPDGVFQNLCVEGAWQLASEIDYALKRLYSKDKKKNKS